MKILIESQYFPSIAYFSLLANSEQVHIDIHENFEKQSYRNRTHIIGANQVQSLSVPVNHAGRKIPIHQLQIDHQQKWMNNHWRAIQSAYGKAPFFDYYGEYFRDEFQRKHERLIGFNQSLLTLCLKLLKLKLNVVETQIYEKTTPEGVIDFRSQIHPKKSLDTLAWFRPELYHQIFGKDFVPNMSILDLLFCTGPDALEVLNRSGVSLMNK